MPPSNNLGDMLGGLLEELGENINEGPLECGKLKWQDWVEKFYPSVCTYTFAERHIRLWNWFDGITHKPPVPYVGIFPRGGAKSTTVELCCARMCAKLSRRFVLYVSETQEQADKHVQAISTLLEKLNINRSVNKFGAVKGWRRDQLRTENGFNVASFGLDAASRGVKLDEFRPDLMIFDDIDNEKDSADVIRKKIDSITKGLIPAGSHNCAFVFVQNLIREDGVFGQLVDGTAEYLINREIYMEPAIRDLVIDETRDELNRRRCRIVSGEPTWEGQDLNICQRMIEDMGYTAFMSECQHEVRASSGYFFDVSMLNYINGIELPDEWKKVCRGWDLAATEGGGDRTVGAKVGRLQDGRIVVLDCVHGQWGSHKVRARMLETMSDDGPQVRHKIPQDPGQAGKSQMNQMKKDFQKYDVSFSPVSGKKSVRARDFAKEVNNGNVWIVRGTWNPYFVDEMKRFTENDTHLHDDFVDAAAEAYNEIAKNRKKVAFS